jgi:formamidopyrimidine-DNA glycosylase
MPELPEVESVRSLLEEKIIGQPIHDIIVHGGGVVVEPNQIKKALIGKTFSEIKRRGKMLYFPIDINTYLVCHLKMTGQFLYLGEENIGTGYSFSHLDFAVPNKHTHLEIMFADGGRLFYNDIRKFGYIKLCNTKEIEQQLDRFGIEPLTENFTWEAFQNIFKNRTTTIKALLLNQQLIAGLGNIYVDEVCYYAKVHPTRRVNTLSITEKKDLFTGSELILRKAIASGGTSFRDYRNIDGERGNYLYYLDVYKQEGKACKRCKNNIIEKIKFGGRGTHFCPGCQV